jgi:hypothetical protein
MDERNGGDEIGLGVVVVISGGSGSGDGGAGRAGGDGRAAGAPPVHRTCADTDGLAPLTASNAMTTAAANSFLIRNKRRAVGSRPCPAFSSCAIHARQEPDQLTNLTAGYAHQRRFRGQRAH